LGDLAGACWPLEIAPGNRVRALPVRASRPPSHQGLEGGQADAAADRSEQVGALQARVCKRPVTGDADETCGVSSVCLEQGLAVLPTEVVNG
jgi:hypothetical protein